MNKEPYSCPECDGTLTTECPCCGSDEPCTTCDETGLDPLKVNISAFRDAENKQRSLAGGSAWELLENGQYVGRCGGRDFKHPDWRLYYEDFPVSVSDSHSLGS